MLIPCYELRLLNTIIVLCSSANYVLLLLFPISCYLDSLNMAWKCSPCNLMANLGVTILTTKIVEFWSWSWSTLDWPYDQGNFRIMAMVMVNFEVTILTTKIVEFWHGHGQLWIDHMTMEIIELWPWSWSIFFDHFDHIRWLRPNGQKIVVALPPPKLYYSLNLIRSLLSRMS